MMMMMIVSVVEKAFLHTTQVDPQLSGFCAATVTAGIMRLVLVTQLTHLCVTSVRRILLKFCVKCALHNALFSHALILWSPVLASSMQLGYKLQYICILVRVPCRTKIGILYNPLVCLL